MEVIIFIEAVVIVYLLLKLWALGDAMNKMAIFSDNKFNDIDRELRGLNSDINDLASQNSNQD